MINDTIKTSGELHIVLRDGNGNIKKDVVVPNLVVTVGKNTIASRLTGITTPVMSHMAVGAVGTAPTAANVSLAGEIANSRTVLSVPGGAAAANVVTYTAVFPAGVGSGAIVEAGIFNNSVGGTMLCRTSFAVLSKEVEDSLTISWAVTIS